MTNEKIKNEHLQRVAIVYVRQSSTFQVANYHESRRLQYAMKKRLEDFGWQSIEIIDDDLGVSASGAADRNGFERMLTMVFNGCVGAVAAFELSRFARNSKDWQQLIEVCKMVDTLLIDHDAVYNPALGNDRLLLGVKGSIAEYELDILHQRSVVARQAKAKRGELPLKAPIGYINVEEPHIYEITPDKRISEAIKFVYHKFFELGSVRRVLLWYKSVDMEFPAFSFHGKTAEIIWRSPSYTSITRVLTNPVYAGAYAYGKTSHKKVLENGKTRLKHKLLCKNQWMVLIKDHHEGYITWEEHELIETMIADNAYRKDLTTRGAARKGAALLCGLLRCRRCGKKLSISYTGYKQNALRYCCYRGTLDNGEPNCIHVSGRNLDEAVTAEVLRIVKPGFEQAVMEATNQRKQKMCEKLRILQLELDEAMYTERRAWKQFNGVDPDNRLVATQLEKRWNNSLQKVSHLETKLAQEQSAIETTVTASMEDFATLAGDLHAVWNHPDVDVDVKKRLLRALIVEIVIDTFPDEGRTEMIIHWQGGSHTVLNVKRVRRGRHHATSTTAIEAIEAYVLLFDDDLIAGCLNRNGLRTGSGLRWTGERVHSIRGHRKIKQSTEEEKSQYMNLTDAAKALNISTTTLRKEAEKSFPCIHPLPDGPWIFKCGDIFSDIGKELSRRVDAKRKALGTEHSSAQQIFNF